MKVKVFFIDSEFNSPDFELYLRLLWERLDTFFQCSPFLKMYVECFKGVPNETQKEKACNKGVCKQRRNKTVNASKSS